MVGSKKLKGKDGDDLYRCIVAALAKESKEVEAGKEEKKKLKKSSINSSLLQLKRVAGARTATTRPPVYRHFCF
jgi:hypothetical protein